MSEQKKDGPWLKTYKDGTIMVGYAEYARDKDGRDYYGPSAEITAHDCWFTVSTDHYEGSAMMRIETLPTLIRALRLLQKQVKAKKSEAQA
jgi:hypothetical protein